MSEAEMISYRFNSGKEPTDEMLAQIMREAADAKTRHEEATKNFFDELRKGCEEQQAKWADRINQIKKANTEHNCYETKRD